MTTRMMALNLVKVIVIGALVIYGIRASFNHKVYENTNSKFSVEYLTHKSKYKPINKKRRKDLEDNWNKFQSIIDNGSYTKEQKTELQLIHDTDKEIIATSKKELKEYTKVKKGFLAKYKYKGWNAYYYFRLMIGPHETSFVLSLILLYVLFNPITSKIKKFLFLIFSGAFLFTSSYFILHSLFAQRVFDGDFPKNWYINIMRYIPILVSITLPLLFYHYHNIETKLKNIIRMFFDVIYKDIPEGKFIKPEKEKEYRRMRIKITDKVVGNE